MNFNLSPINLLMNILMLINNSIQKFENTINRDVPTSQAYKSFKFNIILLFSDDQLGFYSFIIPNRSIAKYFGA